jgi:hypothetical protein
MAFRGDKKGKQRRLLAKAARSDTYWEGGKDPFPTNPRKDFKSFMGGVRGGEIPLLDLKRRPLTAFGVTKKNSRGSLEGDLFTPSINGGGHSPPPLHYTFSTISAMP